MSGKKVLAIGGDGVGPEVIDATLYVLENAGFDLEISKPPEPPAGEPYDDELLKKLIHTSDAVLFGASGPPTGRPSRGEVMGYLRWDLDNYINIRPVKYYPGAVSILQDPTGIDFVMLRENSEGSYSFIEGNLSLLRQVLPDYRSMRGKSFADYGEGKFAIRVISERGSQRLAKFACEFTMQRKKDGYPGRLTCVTKSNVFRQSDVLLEKAIEAEVKKYAGISYERYYVDDMARRLLRYPKEYDVIVTENLFGDILSDEASELIGGLGLVPSANVGGVVPYFESVHGSAPKYAGKNVINPTAEILSAKLMLDYFGMRQEAEALEKAVAEVYKEGKSLTYDQSGSASTTEFAEVVLRKMK
jgi:isocitrate/isopropylmalate dehydrogenase